jgi:hypothetical protein
VAAWKRCASRLVGLGRRNEKLTQPGWGQNVKTIQAFRGCLESVAGSICGEREVLVWFTFFFKRVWRREQGFFNQVLGRQHKREMRRRFEERDMQKRG